MYVVISVVSTILPLLIVVLLWRLLFKVLGSVLEKGRRRPDENMQTEQPAQKTRDLAAEFERKLREKKKEKVVEPETDSSFKVYREPASEVEFKQNIENWQPVSAVAAAEEKQHTKVRFTHEALVNGFIMGEILDKPRSMKPYDGNF